MLFNYIFSSQLITPFTFEFIILTLSDLFPQAFKISTQSNTNVFEKIYKFTVAMNYYASVPGNHC